MTKNKPVRKKPKSFTPIVFKISKEQQDAIKRPPRTSLNRFRTNQADATDWFNIAFRIRVGVYLAKEEYAQETLKDMSEAFTFCDVLYTRAKQDTGPDWSITADEADYLQSALDVVDIMQDDTTRRVQLDAHHVAKKLMGVYVKGFDSYLAKVKLCVTEN